MDYNYTCYYCGKTDSSVTHRLVTAGNFYYWYHPDCYAIAEQLAKTELFPDNNQANLQIGIAE